MSAKVTNTVTTDSTLTTTTTTTLSSSLDPVDVTDHHNHNHHDNVNESLSEIVLNSNENGNEPNGNTTMMIVDNQKNHQKSNWVKFDEDGDSNNVNNNKNNNKNPVVVNINQTPLTTIPIAKTAVTPLQSPSSSKVQKTKEIPTIPGPPPAQDNKSSPKSSLENTPPAVLTPTNLNVVTTSQQTTTISSSTSARNDTAPKTTTTQHQVHTNNAALPMRTIELSTGRIREGFANGDIIVTLLPTNTKWPWITPAVFRPELVPEELMAQGLTLTVEEYVNAMETLVNDYRFTVYNICYKRVLVCWILFAFCVLLTLLFSGLKGIALFSLGVGWLFLNVAAIFFCMWIKLKLSRGLEKCLARVNKQLVRHKILLVLDDRGRISCHKVNLCFLYFDPAQCIAYLNEYIERSEQNGTNIQAGWEAKLDVDINDIVIQGSNPVRLSRKQERCLLLYLRYGSRWGNEAMRGLIDVSIIEPARHCSSFICPCQYIERHLSCKPRDYPCSCCAYITDPHFQYQY